MQLLATMEKIKELLCSFNKFKDRQIQTQDEFTWSQQDLLARFDLLQKEFVGGCRVTNQEETAWLVAKKLKKTPKYQFCWKSNEQHSDSVSLVLMSSAANSSALRHNLNSLQYK